MEPLSLSSEGCLPPLLKCCRVVVLIDGFVEASGKALGKVSDSEGVVDVKVGVANEFFKFCNITIGVLGIHFESLHDDGPCLFFLQNIGVLSSE